MSCKLTLSDSVVMLGHLNSCIRNQLLEHRELGLEDVLPLEIAGFSIGWIILSRSQFLEGVASSHGCFSHCHVSLPGSKCGYQLLVLVFGISSLCRKVP